MSTDKTWSQATHTLTIIDQKNPSREHVRVLHDGYLSDLLDAIQAGSVQSREEFRKANGLAPLVAESSVATQSSETPTTGILRIDYNLTHDQMIAAGRYDWKNSDITAERFPVTGQGIEEFEYKVFDFGRDISSKDADATIVADDKDNPWESAGTAHILAFGAQNPNAQRKNPIVALKAVGEVGGVRHVVYLDGSDALRDLFLGLGRWGGDWNAVCRFLAVRKLKKSVS